MDAKPANDAATLPDVARVHDPHTLQGHQGPLFLYGTAWKEDATEGLVSQALEAGFRGIDTANQRKHYFEEGVGRAIRKALSDGRVQRGELFVQTKFTFARGQDGRLPYDPAAPVATQVEQSFRSSLSHLGVASLDALLLHGPTQSKGLVSADRAAWSAMEQIHDAGGARLLGISNVACEQLEALLAVARVAPAFVQNRCYAKQGWDADVRALCGRSGIVYQGFSLLTANRQVLLSPVTRAIARAHGVAPEQVIFGFAMAVGMIPLTGTTSVDHMKLDLRARKLALTPDEVGAMGRVGTTRADEPEA